MTTTLLEEVEKQRVSQKEHGSSRGSTGVVGGTVARDFVGGGANAAPVVAAAATTTDVAVKSSVTSITHKSVTSPVPEAHQGRHDQNGGAGVGTGGKGVVALTFDTQPENQPSAVGHRAVAPAVAGQGIKDERKRVALATIEQLRSHTASGSSVARRDSAGSHPSGRPDGKRLSSTAVVPAARAATPTTRAISKFNLSEAFSAQSVRFGATLGYYGREEIDALFLISKNPSRVAAYNRIIEGKDGGCEEEKASPEVQTTL